MTVEATLDLARSYGVEVRLNAAQDGLRLEFDEDPPQALVNVLKRAKWEIVAVLRQREIDGRRPLITRWINDHFTSTPLGICRHCGESAREGDIFVRLYCGDDSGDVHTSCQPAWQEAEEARARAALGLVRTTGLFDGHFALLHDIEEARPHDANDAQWDVATRGLRTFLAAGQADEALSLGWPESELFEVPLAWGNTSMCGPALLIGDREVVNITSTEIRIKTSSDATLAFYRKPQIDCGLAYRARITMAGEDGCKEEVQLRAFEHTVNLFCANNPSASIDEAKVAVLVAIASKAERP